MNVGVEEHESDNGGNHGFDGEGDGRDSGDGSFVERHAVGSNGNDSSDGDCPGGGVGGEGP